MTAKAGPFAYRIVRAWTRLYTWRLPAAVRQRRCAEIESDLWEFERDSIGTSPLVVAAHVVARLMFGMHADLAWRGEHVHGHAMSRTKPIVWTLAMLAFLTAWWVVGLMQTDTLPQPPAGQMRFIAAPPPPPEIEGP
jgi:hypothetical protein